MEYRSRILLNYRFDTVQPIPADLIPIGTTPIGATMYSRRWALSSTRLTQGYRKGIS